MMRVSTLVSAAVQELKAHSLHRFVIIELPWGATQNGFGGKVEYPPEPTLELRVASSVLKRSKTSDGAARQRESLTGDEVEEEEQDSIGAELAVLPPEILAHVLQFCSARCLISLASTSSHWHHRIVYESDYLWQKMADRERQTLGMRSDQTWADMAAKLPHNDRRFVVFMWERTPESFLPIFISWSPDGSRIRSQAIYSVHASFFRMTLELTAHVEATSFDELNSDYVEDNLRVRKG